MKCLILIINLFIIYFRLLKFINFLFMVTKNMPI